MKLVHQTRRETRDARHVGNAIACGRVPRLTDRDVGNAGVVGNARQYASRISALGAAIAIAICSAAARADSLGDPMRPAGAKAAASSSVRGAPKGSRVTAIFTSGERRVAVFDGRVVRAGDRVGDVVILDVLSDGVRFAQSGRIEIVRLPKQSVVVRREGANESKSAAKVSQEIEP